MFNITNKQTLLSVCSKIASDKFVDGYVRMPILFKNKYFKCGHCDTIGKGSCFYVYRSAMFAKMDFTICRSCKEKNLANHNVVEKPFTCGGCGGGSIASKNTVYMTVDNKITHFCNTCAVNGRYSSKHIPCKMCSKYHEPQNGVPANKFVCVFCMTDIEFCATCNSYHFRKDKEHKRVKFVLDGKHSNNIDSIIKLACNKTVVMSKDLASLIKKHQDSLKRKLSIGV